MSRGRAWLVALTAMLAMSVSYADRQIVSAVATSVRGALGIDATAFGWLAGAFSLSYLVFAPIAGAMVDRIGARRGLIVAILAWSCVSAAHALAPSFAAIFLLRVLLGLTEAPSFPSAAQSVRRALPPKDRSAGLGLIFTGSSIGAAVAAPLAVWLDVHFGWRAAFLVASTLGLAWLPVWLAVTRRREVREALATPDATAAATQGAPSSLLPPPSSRIALLAEPAVLRCIVMTLCSAPVLMFVFLWLPQYLELGRGLPKPTLGAYLWLPPVMADVGMLGFGVLASALDRRHPGGQRSHVELLVTAALLAATIALVPRVADTWGAVLVVGVACIGGGGLYTLLTADVLGRVDPGSVSTVSGMLAASQSLVYIVGNPLVGRWVDRTHSFDGVMVAFGALTLPGAVAWALWPVRRGPAAALTSAG
jgi:ACS family hexuronate transporter-like MFS transporter